MLINNSDVTGVSTKGFSEKYPQASPTFDRNASYTVDGVNVEIELHNEEGQIHTFSGTTKDGFLRYEILARETSQDGTLWMINNLYTVDVSFLFLNLLNQIGRAHV